MFREHLKKAGQIFGRVDFEHSEFPSACVVPTEILKRSGETERACNGRSQRHCSQIIFATVAAKSLLQIDVRDFVGRQSPLFDQFRPQHRFIDELVAAADWANL